LRPCRCRRRRLRARPRGRGHGRSPRSGSARRCSRATCCGCRPTPCGGGGRWQPRRGRGGGGQAGPACHTAAAPGSRAPSRRSNVGRRPRPWPSSRRPSARRRSRGGRRAGGRGVWGSLEGHLIGLHADVAEGQALSLQARLQGSVVAQDRLQLTLRTEGVGGLRGAERSEPRFSAMRTA
jgi:hypothetical protein